MDTKLRGDIAEQAVILQALKRGWGILKPLGDRLPYDLAFDVNGVCVFPVDVFVSYSSGISLVVAHKRQRKPHSAAYRDAWELILQRATREEIRAETPAKFGGAGGGVIPSQALTATSLGKV